MGYKNSAKRRADSQYCGIVGSVGDPILRQLEIDLSLTQQQARHDLLIEVRIGEETKLQAGLRVARSLASRSRAERPSGSSGSFNSVWRRC